MKFTGRAIQLDYTTKKGGSGIEVTFPYEKLGVYVEPIHSNPGMHLIAFQTVEKSSLTTMVFTCIHEKYFKVLNFEIVIEYPYSITIGADNKPLGEPHRAIKL